MLIVAFFNEGFLQEPSDLQRTWHLVCFIVADGSD